MRPALLVVLVVWSCAAVLCADEPVADQGFFQRAADRPWETPQRMPEPRYGMEGAERVAAVSATASRIPAESADPIGAASTVAFPAPGPETPPAATGQDGEYYTLDELRTEMKKLAWTKGDFRIVPYGWLWGSAIYETERSFPGPYTLYVLSATDEGEHSFVIDTRRTRLGFDVAGPRIPMFGDAESGGKAEIDFHGAFVVENKPGVLLRHAYGEIKNDQFRLLAGQTYDVISPLYPGTLSYSVGWGGGNIGYRRAQVRLERYFDLSDGCLLTVQGSGNQNIVSDFASTPGIRTESSAWPVIEGRVATTLGDRNPGGRPVTFGVSGHIGEQGFDFLTPGPPPFSPPVENNARRRTWSVNADLYVPLTERFGVQAEFFTGENLSTFLGGVIQGVSPLTHETIRSTGGWFDVWYDWSPRLHSHAGYGLDDPLDADVIQGRSYNQFIFANMVFDVTKNLNVGFEVSSWETLYIDNRPGGVAPKPGESVGLEFTGKYGF